MLFFAISASANEMFHVKHRIGGLVISGSREDARRGMRILS